VLKMFADLALRNEAPKEPNDEARSRLETLPRVTALAPRICELI